MMNHWNQLPKVLSRIKTKEKKGKTKIIKSELYNFFNEQTKEQEKVMCASTLFNTQTDNMPL